MTLFEEFEQEHGRPPTEKEKRLMLRLYREIQENINRIKQQDIINAIMGIEIPETASFTITVKESEVGQ